MKKCGNFNAEGQRGHGVRGESRVNNDRITFSLCPLQLLCFFVVKQPSKHRFKR